MLKLLYLMFLKVARDASQDSVGLGILLHNCFDASSLIRPMIQLPGITNRHTKSPLLEAVSRSCKDTITE